MTLSHSPSVRLRRPSRSDPRLVVGIVLITASALLGWWVFSRASQTVTLYEATREIVAGQPVPLEALREVSVAGTVRTDAYAGPATLPDGALVALRAVGEGELVPAQAVGTVAAQELRPVTISLGALAPAQLKVGDAVDLWLLPDKGADEAPILLSERLAVAHLDTTGAGLGASASMRAELMVPVGDLPTVLDALAGPGQLTVMRVPHS